MTPHATITKNTHCNLASFIIYLHSQFYILPFPTTGHREATCLWVNYYLGRYILLCFKLSLICLVINAFLAHHFERLCEPENAM